MLLDSVVFLAFVTVYTVTFLAGTARTLFALVTWFVALVAVSAFTVPLAGVMRSAVPAMSRWASEFFALVIVTAVVGVLGTWGVLWSYRALPGLIGHRLWRPIGSVGLAIQAVLAMVFAIALVTTLTLVAANTIRQLPSDELGLRLRAEVQQSRLEPLVRDVEPWIQKVAIDWVPGEPPSLLGGA